MWIWGVVAIGMMTALVPFPGLFTVMEWLGVRSDANRNGYTQASLHYRPPYLSEEPSYQPVEDERLDAFSDWLPVFREWAAIRQTSRHRRGLHEGDETAEKTRVRQETRMLVYQQLCAFHNSREEEVMWHEGRLPSEWVLAKELYTLSRDKKNSIVPIPERRADGMGTTNQEG